MRTSIAIPENNAKNSAPQSVNYCVTDFRRTPVRLQICSLQFALCSTAFFALFSGIARRCQNFAKTGYKTSKLASFRQFCFCNQRKIFLSKKFASLCKCAPDRSVPGQVLPRLADHGGRRKNVSFSGFFVILGLTKWGFMNIIEMMFSVIHVVKYCLAGGY